MELVSWVNGNVNILALAGSFDAERVPAVGQWIEAALKAGKANLVINLSDVAYIDTEALSTLLQGKLQAIEMGGDLLLCSPNRPVQMIFEMTRLNEVFELFASEADAMRMFRGLPSVSASRMEQVYRE